MNSIQNSTQVSSAEWSSSSMVTEPGKLQFIASFQPAQQDPSEYRYAKFEDCRGQAKLGWLV